MSVITSYTYTYTLELQSHAHEHAHIIIPLEGSYYISFLGREFSLTPGEIGFVPPAVEHDFSCRGRAITLNIPREMVKPVDLPFLTENCILPVDEKLEPLVYLIRQEIEDPLGKKESLRYLFYFLYDKFASRRFLVSLRYIQDNYSSPDISVADLAAMENYNVSYYTDWFKKNVGYMPSEYLQKIRIEKAKEILATTRYRVLDVALQVGYTNASSFSRAFKALEHMTPQEYRNTIYKKEVPK